MHAARWLLLLLVVPLAAPAAIPQGVFVTGEAHAWTTSPRAAEHGGKQGPAQDDITNVSHWLVGEPTRPERPAVPEVADPSLERTGTPARSPPGSWLPSPSADAPIETPAGEAAPPRDDAPPADGGSPPSAEAPPAEDAAPPSEALPPAEPEPPTDETDPSPCGLCVSLRLL